MFPFLMFVAVAAALMGMLNSLHRFFIPAVSPAMFNVGSILCTLGLAPVMPLVGWPVIMAPAIGVLVGGFGQMAMQWPALRREGFRYEPVFDFSDPGLRQVLTLMGPGIVGLAAVQINLVVNSILAMGEGTGAVSALSFAFRLMYMPIGIFGVSIATAVVPTLSRHAARNDIAGMRDTVSSGLRLMLMLNVPATVGLMVLATPIVALIFEHGRFTAANTAATAAALACYAPGLIGYSAVKIAVPAFYSLRDSRTPVLVSVTTVLVNVGLNLTLVRLMGFQGLALGTAVSAIFNAGVLLWLLAVPAGRARPTPRGGLVRPDRRRVARDGPGGLGRRRRHCLVAARPHHPGHGPARRLEHHRRPHRPRSGRAAAAGEGIQRSPGDGAGAHAAGRRGGHRGM